MHEVQLNVLSELCDAWLPRVHKHQVNVQRNDFGNATTIYILTL